jgi:hypothetical protein
MAKLNELSPGREETLSDQNLQKIIKQSVASLSSQISKKTWWFFCDRWSVRMDSRDVTLVKIRTRKLDAIY